MSTTTRVFISYSHDSLEFKQGVRGLADRLRESGVDAWLDQYTPAPPEGWPRWMEAEINKADFVLLVCTENYYKRVSMNATPGTGLGALWESHLIFQLLYEAGTVNPKFIPVLPTGGKTANIPVSLRSVQRYSPFSEEGFLELYRRLTEQPAIQVPALGNRLVMPPLPSTSKAAVPSQEAPAENVHVSTSRLAVLAGEEGIAYIPVKESHWDEHEASMLFEPDEQADGPFLDGLRRRQRIRLAYKNNAAVCTAQSVQQRSKDGIDQWQIVFRLEKTDFGASMEFQTQGLTPDDAAMMRAERLLLNEHPPVPESRNMGRMMREVMLRGQQVEVEVIKSPFPELFREFGKSPALFVEIAWILAVLHLKMSATVEQINRLELTLVENSLQVEFVGRRRKVYSNQPAAEIKVSGICNL